MKQGQVDAYSAFGQEASAYGRQYSELDLAKIYPEHRFRLNIFLEQLRSIQPKRVLDVGCGSGDPLVEMLREGYDASGFDFSPEMVQQAKKTVEDAGFDPGRVTRNNMEAVTGISEGDFDCIVALGSLYYSRDFPTALRGLVDILPQGGRMVFSLRNELFSAFSLNKYSVDFLLQRLIPASDISDGLRKRLFGFLEQRFEDEDIEAKFQTVDDKGIYSLYHNPLTVEAQVLRPAGLALESIHYYHFHALPPVFEHTDTVEFRRLSAALENPSDWRGIFMSSAFVVHARKE